MAAAHNEYSYEEASELLIYGYVNILELNVPNVIKTIILEFYLLTIETEMVFDKQICDDLCFMEFIDDYKVKMIKGTGMTGTSIKLKYGICADKSQYKNISSISWKIRHTSSRSFPNCLYFIGVVSNRTKNFQTPAWPGGGGPGLKDCYGISGHPRTVFEGKQSSNEVDENYTGYQLNSWVTVQYMIHESKLVFIYLDESKPHDQKRIEIKIPSNVDGITHWYPSMSLRDVDDICELSQDIVVD
eukprot:295922_1